MTNISENIQDLTSMVTACLVTLKEVQSETIDVRGELQEVTRIASARQSYLGDITHGNSIPGHGSQDGLGFSLHTPQSSSTTSSSVSPGASSTSTNC